METRFQQIMVILKIPKGSSHIINHGLLRLSVRTTESETPQCQIATIVARDTLKRPQWMLSLTYCGIPDTVARHQRYPPVDLTKSNETRPSIPSPLPQSLKRSFSNRDTTLSPKSHRKQLNTTSSPKLSTRPKLTDPNHTSRNSSSTTLNLHHTTSHIRLYRSERHLQSRNSITMPHQTTPRS